MELHGKAVLRHHLSPGERMPAEGGQVRVSRRIADGVWEEARHVVPRDLC